MMKYRIEVVRYDNQEVIETFECLSQIQANKIKENIRKNPYYDDLSIRIIKENEKWEN